MKKILLPASLAAALLCCGASAYAEDVVAPERYELYLGAAVSRVPQAHGVWQSSSTVSAGCSSVRYGLENGTGADKFVRFANFDGRYDVGFTAIDVYIGAVSTEALTVSFDYRLFEGADSYLPNDEVLSVRFGSSEKTLSFSDLQFNRQYDYSWKTVDMTVRLSSDSHVDKITLSFFYGAGKRYEDDMRCLDVDDLTVSSGSETLRTVDFEYAEVSTSDEKIVDIDYGDDFSIEKEKYMLDVGSILDHAENNEYGDNIAVGFDGGSASAMLARSGNSGTYRGVTSVNAGESDNFVIYDIAEQNTFLRLANYNGNVGVNSTRMVMYFYDNTTGELGNLPQTNKLYYSFDYRLYIDEITAVGMSPDDNIFRVDTRSSSQNNSGYIKLRDLTVNESGDDSWHTYGGVLETALSQTAYTNFFYYGSDEPSFNTGTYADVDNVYLSNTANGKNYAHLNGTFEGFVDKDGEDMLTPNIGYNSALGNRAQKHAVSSCDYRMKLDGGDTFSAYLGWTPDTNVYYAEFAVTGEPSELTLCFSGRSGDVFELECGKNYTSADGALRAEWREADGVLKCGLFYARKTPTVMYSLDFVNSGDKTVYIDDLFIGQVRSVCGTAGDYEAFSSELKAIAADYADSRGMYAPDTVRAIDRAFVAAKEISEFSSAARMQGVLDGLRSLLDNGTRTADLTELNKTVAAAEELIRKNGLSVYTKASRLTFENALTDARRASAFYPQSDIDALNVGLSAAMDGLTVAVTAEPAVKSVSVGWAVGGGVAGGACCIALGAVLIKRRKRNGLAQ